MPYPNKKHPGGSGGVLNGQFGGESPLTMLTQCGAFRYYPVNYGILIRCAEHHPLGIVTTEQFEKLDFSERSLESAGGRRPLHCFTKKVR